MSGLLNIDFDTIIEIGSNSKFETTNYEVIDEIYYENHLNHPSNRYLLLDLDSEDIKILDIQKDSFNDIKMTLYELIERMDFDLNFLSLVGTSPLGYHNPKMPNIDYIIYEIIEDEFSEKESIKYIVEKSELPQTPKSEGYYEDANGNWYFMAQKNSGELLKFEDKFINSWRYKQDNGERLLIEMEACKNIYEYLRKRPKIEIYEGQEIKRRDIKIHSHSTQRALSRAI
jgi:hypothetical protein